MSPEKGIQRIEMGCLPFQQPWGGIEQALISALTSPDDEVVLNLGFGRTLCVVELYLLVSGFRFANRI